MLELIERCFGEHMIEWGPKLYEMIPTYGEPLIRDQSKFQEQWDYTQKMLKLDR